MSKFFKGDVTNGVVEFNLLDPAVGAGGTTATVITKNTGANVVEQIVGSISSYAYGLGSNGGYDVKGLVIGTSCTSIGTHAFAYCTSLTGPLVIPDSVTSIGTYAFILCANITGPLVIPNSVTTIGSYAFGECSGLTTAYLATPYANIPTGGFGSGAFFYSGLTTVYANDAVANGWTLGAGQTVGGKSGVTVIDWTNYPNIP